MIGNILGQGPIFNEAAMDAVKQWEYEPMTIDGKPQSAIITVTVEFSLR
ncbi:MAG: energy transducer TonB [Candidatus Aminicenantaceae bacterium]